MFAFLPFLSTSRLIKNDENVFRRMQQNKGPLVAFVYNELPYYYTESQISAFKRCSEIFPEIDFVFFDCCASGNKCESLGINPEPSVHFFGAKYHAHSILFTNEISLYALSNYISILFRVSPTIKIEKHENLWTTNITKFIKDQRCAAVFFTNMNNRMSTILQDTIDELAGSFLPEDGVKVGQVKCNKDLDFCIESLGINLAPLLRVYHGDNYSQYKGVREFPYLLDFINKECNTYRMSEGRVNVSLYLDSCSNGIFKENKGKMSYKEMKSKAQKCGSDAIINKVLSKVPEEYINEEIDRANKILASHKIGGDSKDYVEVYKWILERIDQENKNNEL